MKLIYEDVARYYLNEIKKDKQPLPDQEPLQLTVYDAKKHVALVAYGGIYPVPMTGDEFKILSADKLSITFVNRKYYYNGSNFMLCSFVND